MTSLAISIGPLAVAWKKLLIVNPPVGIAVGAVALVGYAIYEECQKK